MLCSRDCEGEQYEAAKKKAVKSTEIHPFLHDQITYVKKKKKKLVRNHLYTQKNIYLICTLNFQFGSSPIRYHGVGGFYDLDCTQGAISWQWHHFWEL